MPRSQLTISPAPYKSSYLAIPPTPFSPLLPITPATPPPPPIDTTARLRATAAQLLPPPSDPLHWLWQCHKCARVYHLGVTRRCLDDGHFFCAGSTVVKRSKRNGYKRTVRHAACASEFDYSGWKAWGSWRRALGEQVEAARVLEEEEGEWLAGRWAKGGVVVPLRLKKDCWGRCDYPSECRWGKQFGVATPAMYTTAAVAKEPEPEEGDVGLATTTAPKTTFEDILIDITDPTSLDYLAPLAPATSDNKAVADGETKMTSVSDLLQSAKRRKRKSEHNIPLIPSPLASNPVEEDEGALSTLARVAIEDEAGGAKGGVLQTKASEFVASWKSAKANFQAGGGRGW